MKLLSIKSTQARLSLLIGVLVVAAAVNAVLAITQAAAFQLRLTELQYFAQQVDAHAEARVSLLKQQIAWKNAVLSYGESQKADADLQRYEYPLSDYVEENSYGEENAPAEDNMATSLENYSTLGWELYDKLYDENASIDDAMELDLNSMDPAADALEGMIVSRAAADQKVLADEFDSIQAQIRQSALYGQIALWLLAVLVVFGIFTTFDIARPIQALIGAIVAFENNTFRPALLARHTRRGDELGQLSLAVSEMAQSISESNRQKEQFMQAAQRFIPSQYLDFLEKDNITKVQLGDHVSAEMAVMFSDIRGFTSMSEHMTAQENFDFVNEYLKMVSPIIQKYEGFIVKFLGDGMMAIFPYGVDDAVKAGIEKGKLVQEFNKTLVARGLGTITVGIGIHTGPMMVGMIGEELRMQGDAFSDNVNLTSRIEGLNKFYGTSMIISEDTLAQLPKPVHMKMRYLGKAVVKGRINPLGMYEIYDGMPQEVIALRDQIKGDFEQGIRLYTSGVFRTAAQAFNKVLIADPADKTARYYFESCAELVDQPLPDGWTGAIVMDSK